MQFHWANYVGAIPEMFLGLMVLLSLLVGVFSPRRMAARYTGLWARLSLWGTLSLIGLNWGWGLQIFGFPRLVTENTIGTEFMFVADPYALAVKALLVITTLFVFSTNFAFIKRTHTAKPEYSVLLLLCCLGGMLMVSAYDFIVLYAGLEMMSFALYIFAAYDRKNGQSSEAGLKYFVLGSLASCVLLFGVSFIYGFAGSTGFAAVAQALQDHVTAGLNIGVMVGLVLVMVGFAFKLSAVPFHMWAPDVFQGAPTPVTALLAVLPKIAAMALFIRVLMVPLAALEHDWAQIVLVLSLLSMGVGAFLAIVQDNLKRMMAYSAITHVGFMLVALAAGGSGAAVQSILVYLVLYTVTTLGVFAVLMGLHSHGRYVETVDDLKGLAKHMPFMAAALMVFMFSLVGIPPLAGFFAKFYVFKVAVDAQMTWLVVVAVMMSVVAAFYCLKLVKAMYFQTGGMDVERKIELNHRAMVVVLMGLTLYLGVFPGTIADIAGSAALYLF